ncbi:hypothetical protein DW980_15295, partial [Bacteroides stercoris]
YQKYPVIAFTQLRLQLFITIMTYYLKIKYQIVMKNIVRSYKLTTTTIYNHHDILLKNKISDSYEKYCEELQTSYIRYDNYFIFGEIALWGISYNIDTEILTLGFDNSIKVIVESCFQGKKLIISSQLADKINHDILNYKFNEYHLE